MSEEAGFEGPPPPTPDMPAEVAPDSPEAPAHPTADQLLGLGTKCLEASQRDDLEAVAAAHAEKTGKDNPNSHRTGFFTGEGELPMSADSVYRSVDVRGIEDLAESGVVRGAYTATDGERAQTSGHTTYWNPGNPDKKHPFKKEGAFIIEAPKEAADAGWVTADKVTAIHTKNEAGEIVDLLGMAREAAAREAVPAAETAAASGVE
ncbi:MAG TPA: hypothetical protein VG604_02715 [Candidatus Saccharimonadales bacterium]|nr:hypothetical protein [Candidatus Saccharimonadales bacterium]